MTNKQTRKKKILTFLIVLLVAVFFITATIIAIIVTEGGRFTKDGIVETGSIRLQIQPSDRNANVFLNDKPVKLESSFINNVTPGEHTVRIESNQFHIWEKQVLVRPALVTTLEARLFPLEPELKQITQTNIDQVFFSKDGSLAYYLVSDSELPATDQGLWLLRLDDQEIFFRRGFTPEKIASASDRIFSLLSSEDVEVVPSDDGSQLLVISEIDNKLYIFNPKANNEAEKLNDISTLIGFKPENISWFNNNNSVIVSNSEIILELNLVNGEKTLINYTQESSPVYASNGSTVVFYQPSSKNLQSYQNKLIKDIKLSGVIIPDNVTDLRITNDAKSLLLSANLDHYFIDTELSKLRLIHRGSRVMDFSSDGTAAIFEENGKILTAAIEKILSTKDIEVKITSTEINPTHNPHFINNSNLVVFNNEDLSKLQVSENDGSNIVNIIQNTSVVNGYYVFQRSGASVVVLITDASDDNVLNTNLFKLNFGGGILPFEL